jgi:hypothetical protein
MQETNEASILHTKISKHEKQKRNSAHEYNYTAFPTNTEIGPKSTNFFPPYPKMHRFGI